VHGFSVVSLDCQPSAKADITINVLEWDYKKDYKPGDFALIAAGVPCTEYSVAKTTIPPRNLEAADRLVAKTLEIIAFFGQKDGGSRTQGGACSKVEK
jgi:site-specific DNA-cytosine methylase